MSIRIRFSRPRIGVTRLTRRKTESYDDWLSRFEADDPSDFAVTEDLLLGYALDCGYGDIEHQRLLHGLIDAGSRERLRTALARRWESVLALMYVGPGPSIFLHPVTNAIETTDKGDAAFVLGSVCSRIAIQDYLRNRQKPKRDVKHYLHRALYANANLGRLRYQVRARSGKKVPDYIVSDSIGDWHVVEAKGSLDQVSPARLNEGLKQALNVATIEAVNTGVGRMRPSSASVVGGGFDDPAAALSITHIDPPAPDDAFHIQVCTELADLANFLLRIELWGALTLGEPTALRIDATSYTLMPLALNGWNITRFIGIVKAVANALDDIKTTLAVVGYYVPAVTAYADAMEALDASETDALALWKKHLSERRDELAALEVGREDPDVNVALNFAALLLDSETAPAGWTAGVEMLVQAPLLLDGSTGRSAQDLALYLRVAVEKAELDVTLLQDLAQREDGNAFHFHRADYGLALFSTRQVRPA